MQVSEGLIKDLKKNSDYERILKEVHKPRVFVNLVMRLNMYSSDVLRLLNQLETWNLVEVQSPKLSVAFYRSTAKGREALENI
jgi:hypothetical protein